MLDALVAEARLRWGLDPADGSRSFAAETLVGAPIEPSRPAADRPARDAPGGTDGGRTRAAPRSRRAVADATRWRSSRRLYPADHPVGRFGAADGDDGRSR